MKPSIPHYLGFDDRPLVVLGIPVLAFVAPVFFFGKSPVELGWAGFAPFYLVSLLYTCLYWLLTRYVIALGHKYSPAGASTTGRLLKTVAVLAVFTIFIEANCSLLIGALVPDAAPGQPGYRGYSLWQTAPVSLVIVLGMAGVYEAIYYFHLYRHGELERERLLRMQAEMELATLSKQVDPHFLFNSLNTLVAVLPPGRKWRRTSRST